jgi:predicted SnoaL-like aldol condensation-catalyzing enzyme
MKKLKKTTISLVVSATLILLFASCNSQVGNVSGLKASNDSLTKQISLYADTLKLQEFNKKLVADFYQQLFGDKDISAIDKYIGDVYIQHNPGLKDGKEALKQGAALWFKGAPKEKINIQHIGADGKFVYIHTKAGRGSKIVSVLDIFRLENGKITEHWDIIQEVPEKIENPHPMF